MPRFLRTCGYLFPYLLVASGHSYPVLSVARPFILAFPLDSPSRALASTVGRPGLGVLVPQLRGHMPLVSRLLPWIQLGQRANQPSYPSRAGDFLNFVSDFSQ